MCVSFHGLGPIISEMDDSVGCNAAAWWQVWGHLCLPRTTVSISKVLALVKNTIKHILYNIYKETKKTAEKSLVEDTNVTTHWRGLHYNIAVGLCHV